MRLLCAMSLCVSLACAAGERHALEDGLWASAGRAPFADRVEPREVPSPDGRLRAVGDAHGRVHIVKEKRDTVLAGPTFNPALTEVLWSPDSRYVVVNQSEGGAVGQWQPFIYAVRPDGSVSRRKLERAVVRDAASLPQGCYTREAPNLVVVGFPAPRELLFVASVLPHSNCRNLGEILAYRVRLSDGRIVERISEVSLRERFGHLLGRTYVDWHEVREVELSFGIRTAAERIELEFPIKDIYDKTIYWFTCVGGSEDFLDHLQGARREDLFVKDMICTLNKEPGPREETLLAEDDIATWHTRGQFHWEDLVGDCGRYPEYGRERHFRLRGMEITLAATDLVESQGALSYFKLDVSVKNRPDAKTAWAERPRYLHPRGDCAHVKEGVEPRMCRNARGDLVDCDTQRARNPESTGSVTPVTHEAAGLAR